MSQQEVTQSPEQQRAPLEYARDLFTDYLQTQGTSVFTTLGYTERQKTEVKKALGAMNQDGNFLTNPPRARYGVNEQGGLIYMTTLGNVGSGGFKLYAENLMQLSGPNVNSATKHINETRTHIAKEGMGFPLAVIEMLRENDTESIEQLVESLYNGSWATSLQAGYRAEPKINPVSIKGLVKNILSRDNAGYKAAWVDEDTKLELVVQTDIYNRPIFGRNKDKKGPTTEIWRRLPEAQGEDGRVWIPFGKKPNPSETQMQKALEGEKTRSFSAKLLKQL